MTHILRCVQSSLLLAFATIATGAPPFASPPLIGYGGKTCESPPEILSYHVHVVFDGANKNQTAEAIAALSAFSKAMSALSLLRYAENGQRCPFSHTNPSPTIEYICPFQWDSKGQLQPWTGVGLFGGENYAFFIPTAHYVVAMNWWRQHHGSLSTTCSMSTQAARIHPIPRGR